MHNNSKRYDIDYKIFLESILMRFYRNVKNENWSYVVVQHCEIMWMWRGPCEYTVSSCHKILLFVTRDERLI